jgi:hypothetical protein
MAGGKFTGIAIQQAQLTTASGHGQPIHDSDAPKPDRDMTPKNEIEQRLEGMTTSIPADADHTHIKPEPIPTHRPLEQILRMKLHQNIHPRISL